MGNPIWGYNEAYILSEWGYHSYWGVDRTSWNSPLEPYTNSKAPRFKGIWNDYILKDSTRCFGGYVFYWGQKQEFTNSWYSLFSKNGCKTAIIDTLSSIWSGKKFKNSAPHILKLKINDEDNFKNIVLKKSSSNVLNVYFKDYNQDSVKIYAEIRHETSMRIDDYGIEKEPLEVKGLIRKIEGDKIYFNAPANAGIYRIYVDLCDRNRNCDMANLVFKVN